MITKDAAGIAAFEPISKCVAILRVVSEIGLYMELEC